jgi:transmembrane sensor
VNYPQTAPAAEQLIDELAQWLVMMDAAPLTEAEKTAFEHWKNQSDEHRLAWVRAQKMEAFFTHVPPDISAQILKKPRTKTPVLHKLVVLLAIGGVVLGTANIGHQQAWLADYRTTYGEQRNITLADGTQIILNSKTAIDVDFSDTARKVILRHGEIFVQTGHPSDSATRPFYIQSEDGTIKALGTQFNVAREQAQTQIAIVEHAVQIDTAQSREQHILNQGRALAFKADHIGKEEAIDMSTLMWKKGLLVANRLPLQAFAEQIERYYDIRVSVDADSADTIISGTYPINDLPALTAALSSTYQLQVKQQWFGRQLSITKNK